ncbi:MAG: hypothetical protein PHY34_03090 [Patescibacteria group bacterium]|nr:hypothetical protein [Patescibacteria group bacterium]MDD5716139.1 hypothetical protein [Patescibacteria group bacterium]
MPIVEQYEVVLVSDEFLEVLEDFPEACLAKSVTIGDRKIEGPMERFYAPDQTAAIAVATEQVKQLPDPKKYTVIITQRKGECWQCPGKENDVVHNCPHLDRIGTVNQPSRIKAADLLAQVA